jgi:hypothetical protein
MSLETSDHQSSVRETVPEPDFGQALQGEPGTAECLESSPRARSLWLLVQGVVAVASALC